MTTFMAWSLWSSGSGLQLSILAPRSTSDVFPSRRCEPRHAPFAAPKLKFEGLHQNSWVNRVVIEGGVFEESQGQKMRCVGRKRAWDRLAPGLAESFSHPDLVIPCRVASPQSPTPFHQAAGSLADRRGEFRSRSPRLPEFRLGKVLRSIIPPESDSRATENDPQSRGQAPVVR